MSFCFDPAYFSAYFNRCGAVVDDHHAGLLLDPPPGWQAEGKWTAPPSGRNRSGPLNPRAVQTSIDFNRDDADELWLLGLTDLETN